MSLYTYKITCSYGKFKNVVIFSLGESYRDVKNKIINILVNKYDVKDYIYFNNIEPSGDYSFKNFRVDSLILDRVIENFEKKEKLLFRYKLNKLLENGDDLIQLYYNELISSCYYYYFCICNDKSKDDSIYNEMLHNLKFVNSCSKESYFRIVEIFIRYNINKFFDENYTLKDLFDEINENISINVHMIEEIQLDEFAKSILLSGIIEMSKIKFSTSNVDNKFYLFIKKIINSNLVNDEYIIEFIKIYPYLIFALNPNDDYVKLLPNDFVFNVNIILKESKDVKKYINSKKLTIESKKILINKFINFDSIFSILNSNIFLNDKYAEFLINKFSNFLFFFPHNDKYIEYVESKFDYNSYVLKENRELIRNFFLDENVSQHNKIKVINNFGGLRKIVLLFIDEFSDINENFELNEIEKKIYNKLVNSKENVKSYNGSCGFEETHSEVITNKIYIFEKIFLEYKFTRTEDVYWRSDGEYNEDINIQSYANLQIFEENIIIEDENHSARHENNAYIKNSLVRNKIVLSKIIAFILDEIYHINET